jgi:hypothetical protein
VKYARRAAGVMWFYAAGSGSFTIPVAIYLQQRGRLPSFFNLFDMYGGPWSARLLDDAFVIRLRFGSSSSSSVGNRSPQHASGISGRYGEARVPPITSAIVDGSWSDHPGSSSRDMPRTS